MRPVVLIIESRTEVAAALETAIELSNFTPIVVPHLERLSDIPHVRRLYAEISVLIQAIPS